MTIDNLLIQESFTFDRIESKKRNDAEGKALITFNGYMEYDEDSDAKVYQMLILFDPKSKEITAMKLYGFNLQSVCDYVDEHGCIYWNHIIHYMTDFDSFPQTLVLLTPASLI